MSLKLGFLVYIDASDDPRTFYYVHSVFFFCRRSVASRADDIVAAQRHVMPHNLVIQQYRIVSRHENFRWYVVINITGQEGINILNNQNNITELP